MQGQEHTPPPYFISWYLNDFLLTMPLKSSSTLLTVCLAIVLVLQVGLLKAMQQQAVPQDAPYSLTVDTATAAVNGDIVGLTAAFVNHTMDTLEGSLEILVPSGIEILGNAAPQVKVGAAGKLFLPIKLQVLPDAAAGTYDITLKWVDASGHVLVGTMTKLEIRPKRAVWLQVLNARELMRSIGDSLLVRVTVRNAGNTREQVKLVASLPNQLGGRRFESKTLELPAAKDTIVTFGYIIDKSLMNLEHFTVNIAGLYRNDEVFGNASVSVQNASSNRQYVDPSHSASNVWSYQRNRMTFMARNPFTDNQSWQFDGAGSYQLGRGKLDFSTFAYQWGNLGNQPMLNNTWVNYELKNKGVTIGNITENLETFVNGRGMKVYFSDSLLAEHVEVGVVDRTFDLLGADYRPGFGNGFTVYFRTRLGEGMPEKKRYTGTAIYERLPIENSESILYMNTFDLIRQERQNKIRLVADIGPAITRSLTNQVGQDEYRPSLAAGIHLNANLPVYTISSSNYYSTGYYPGIRRGALQLNQRVSRAIKRTNVWAAYSLFEYAPKYFESQPNFRNYFLVSRAEVGASFPLTDFMSLSVVPVQEYERGSYAFGSIADNPRIDMSSYRINGTLNWRSRNYRQNAYLLIESGLNRSSIANESSLQARANLSYNYAWFNFNANVQRGNFSLIEAANNWYFQRADVYRIGASASVRQNFAEKRLQTELSIGYFKDSFSGENWTGNGRVQYTMTKKTAFFLFGQLYQYNTPYHMGFFNANVQLGIQQALPDSRRGESTQKKGNIELFVYHDHNHNGRYDEGDTPADNTMVLINNTVFITGANGLVRYNRVPHGSQRLSVPMQQGWYAPESAMQLNTRQLKASIALQQAGTLAGSIRYQFDERISQEANTVLGGFTVTASGASGYIARTMTDDNGNYLLFLPAGDYEISMTDNKMPQHVYSDNPVQHGKVAAGKINEGPIFILKVEEKKVEIKRFTSP